MEEAQQLKDILLTCMSPDNARRAAADKLVAIAAAAARR